VSAAPEDGQDRRGKGRPTPRRSEAEQARRRRVKPPANRKEAYRQARAQARAERERRRKALLSGDPRALPRRDQGPVRAFVRDYVDGRRGVAEYFLIVALVVLVVSVVGPALGSPQLANAVFLAWSLMLVLMVVDSVVLGLRLRSALRVRFPDPDRHPDRRGAVGYGLMRSTQLRRLRLPPPRVKPGQKV
jgi:hypothetical protein